LYYLFIYLFLKNKKTQINNSHALTFPQADVEGQYNGMKKESGLLDNYQERKKEMCLCKL